MKFDNDYFMLGNDKCQCHVRFTYWDNLEGEEKEVECRGSDIDGIVADLISSGSLNIDYPEAKLFILNYDDTGRVYNLGAFMKKFFTRFPELAGANTISDYDDCNTMESIYYFKQTTGDDFLWLEENASFDLCEEVIEMAKARVCALNGK